MNSGRGTLWGIYSVQVLFLTFFQVHGCFAWLYNLSFSMPQLDTPCRKLGISMQPAVILLCCNIPHVLSGRYLLNTYSWQICVLMDDDGCQPPPHHSYSSSAPFLIKWESQAAFPITVWMIFSVQIAEHRAASCFFVTCWQLFVQTGVTTTRGPEQISASHLHFLNKW